MSGNKREAARDVFKHRKGMKNKLIGIKLSELLKPKIIAAIAVASGFWFSQYLAWNLISASMIGGVPKMIGGLSFGVFVSFFVVRMFQSWSRLPAILGLCSLGILAAFILSALYFGHFFKIQFIELFMLLSLGLAFTGLGLDAERCWHLIADGGMSNQTQKAKHSLFVAAHRFYTRITS